MTDSARSRPRAGMDLIDAFLSGEIDDAGMARLEAGIEQNPDFLRELADDRGTDQALRVLMGDGTADQRVTVSVLAVLRSAPEDRFKTELLEKVKAEDLKKRNEEQALRATPEVSAGAPVPEPGPVRRPAAPARGRGWKIGLAAAAVLAVAALGTYLAGTQGEAPAPATAFLLSTTPGVRVHRGARTLPAAPYLILQEGDRVRGGEDDLVQLGFPADTSRLTLKADGEFRFVRARGVELLKGELEVAATGEPLAVSTPHAELHVENARALLRSAAEFARVEVLQGSAVLVRGSDGRSVRVEASQYAVAGKGVDLAARAVDKAVPAADAPAAVARLLHVQGDVYLFAQAPADRVPARAGTELRKGQGLLTEGARSLAVLEFPDRTRLEIGPDAVVRHLVTDDGSSKLVRLEAGRVSADVTKQPAGRPMKIATPHAEAAVLGTRFLLASEKDSTRIQVEEGSVQFTAVQGRKSVVVRSGYQATAAPGRPLEEPALVPGGARALEIDLEGGESKGDGLWKVVDGRAVRHSPREGGEAPATHLYKVDLEEGALIEATVEVGNVAPGTPDGRDGWGFGLAAAFDSRDVILRSQQGAGSGSVLEFKDAKAIPFEHGREGRYRLMLRIDRRGETAVLQGKIWQGEREPDGWMIEDELELQGPLTRVGFQSVRCACVFSSFRVKILN